MKTNKVVTAIVLITISFLIIGLAGCSSSNGPDNSDNPVLAVSTASLNYGANLTEMTFDIYNSGTGTLNWSILNEPSWLMVTPTDSSTTSDTIQITATVVRTGLDPDTYSGEITVISESDTAKILVSMIIPVDPTLAVSRENLDFGATRIDLPVYISNSGAGTVTWSITDDRDWISITPTEGSTTTEQDQVMVTIDRTGLEFGDTTGIITISSDGGTIEISVSMIVPVQIRNGEEYFPMAEGDIWYYTPKDTQKTIKRIVSGDTLINGNNCIRIMENDTTMEAWTKDATGFWVHYLAGMYMFVPPLLIPFNLTVEGSHAFNAAVYFTQNDTSYESKLSGALYFEGYVTWNIPAGEFDNVIKLHYYPEGDDDYCEYYARGVGLLDNDDYILDSAYVGGVWYK